MICLVGVISYEGLFARLSVAAFSLLFALSSLDFYLTRDRGYVTIDGSMVIAVYGLGLKERRIDLADESVSVRMMPGDGWLGVRITTQGKSIVVTDMLDHYPEFVAQLEPWGAVVA